MLYISNDAHTEFSGINALLDKIPGDDTLLLLGDMGIAATITDVLDAIAEHNFPHRVAFVLGNHDFYGGKMSNVYKAVVECTKKHNNLIYLSHNEIIEHNDTIIVGQDGIGDMGAGFLTLKALYDMNDFKHIKDFKDLSPQDIKHACNGLGRGMAEILQMTLDTIPKGPNKIMIVSHVPPFPFMSTCNGRPCSEEMLPFFCWKHGGDVIQSFIEKHPYMEIKVVSGHTHDGYRRMIGNTEFIVLNAKYGEPRVYTFDI